MNKPDPTPPKKANGVVEYAPHHGHLSHAPLFTIGRKGPDTKQRQNKFIYEGGRGENRYKVEVWLLDPLTYDDASVFMVLLATAAPSERHTIYEKEHELRKLLQKNKGPEDSPEDSLALGLESNFGEILTKLGWDDSGKSYTRLEESMKRLSAVTIFYKFHGSLWSSGLFGFRIDTTTSAKSFTGTINPVSSMVILGDRSAGCVMSGLHELRALSGQIELALYFDLIRRIKPGETTVISLRSILRQIYDWNHTSNNREDLSKAIKSVNTKLNTLSKWRIRVVGRGRDANVHVTRPLLQKLKTLV